MQTEIEAKFLNVSHEEIREKLKALGARLQHPMRLMRRKNFDFPDNKLERDRTGWVRVRDEGDKCTLAYKQLNDRSLHGTKEVNVIVDSFDDTCLLLEQIGLEAKSYQETKRESWLFDDAQIEIDEWPWIKPFIEIEAPTENELYAIVDKLGLNMKGAVHGSVEIAYQAEYDVSDEEVDHWSEILFVEVPEWLEAKRKR